MVALHMQESPLLDDHVKTGNLESDDDLRKWRMSIVVDLSVLYLNCSL